GLKFREILRPLEEIYTNGVKDVISSWANGWGRAYSIGGRWLYDMEKSNPDNNHWILVKAILTETSHVAVGADQWALSNRPDVSFVEIEGKIAESDTLEKNIKGYIDTKDDSYLKKILEKKE
ncbi:MAG: hypothetical protein GY756_10060, partial [bacterium]|nr:hypothetical protein [bacterium]